MSNIQWSKSVCQLDGDNLYVGQATADLNIYARDGSYIIPGGCIDTNPPELTEGHAARWNGEGWDFLADHRGKIAYRKTDGTAVTISQVGSLSDDLTMIAPPSEYCSWDGEKWIENQAKKAEAEETKIATAKVIALSRLNQRAQAIVNEQSGMDDLPAFEVQSWPVQASEARAWSENNSAPTPVLDQIAQARGINPDKLKAAALKKTLAYESLCGTVAGKRQAIEKQIEAAKTLDELNTINTGISL
ncbi:hypothetical protein HMPREF2568_05620 [Neisseria sp. HMSC059F02]|nr:hypothetical protein HMPREF2568_05620 [Neisseria sp. HMSC059F02]